MPQTAILSDLFSFHILWTHVELEEKKIKCENQVGILNLSKHANVIG